MLLPHEADLGSKACGQLLYAAGFATLVLGDYARASALLAGALDAARLAADSQIQGLVLLLEACATPLAACEPSRAQELFHASRELQTSAGDDWAAGFAVIGLAEFAILQGDLQTGQPLLDAYLSGCTREAMCAASALGWRW